MLANAVELSANLIMAVAGEAVSNTINGERIPPATMKSAITATIQRKLTKDQGVV
ncbi:hypothetical protein [Streptomyces sp. CHB9.2]|uniref:hypothetical protein n=1 Tax=Streptomyces sp. CHB9.2 TaxID=2841670 RepID=UPI0020948E63|nr:hypothetical protein [Streptomyces sp. CHB9.2]MCO6704865.1 hypothetical protein [Streptomyces sp. CHB9.2]